MVPSTRPQSTSASSIESTTRASCSTSSAPRRPARSLSALGNRSGAHEAEPIEPHRLHRTSHRPDIARMGGLDQHDTQSMQELSVHGAAGAGHIEPLCRSGWPRCPGSFRFMVPPETGHIEPLCRSGGLDVRGAFRSWRRRSRTHRATLPIRWPRCPGSFPFMAPPEPDTSSHFADPVASMSGELSVHGAAGAGHIEPLCRSGGLDVRGAFRSWRRRSRTHRATLPIRWPSKSLELSVHGTAGTGHIEPLCRSGGLDVRGAFRSWRRRSRTRAAGRAAAGRMVPAGSPRTRRRRRSRTWPEPGTHAASPGLHLQYRIPPAGSNRVQPPAVEHRPSVPPGRRGT